jgi:hypothetical protein
MAQELQRSAIWYGKQAAKGTENTTPTHRALQVAGDFELNRDIGSVQVSDGTKYGSQIRFLNTMAGTGTPGIEATPSEMASLLWLAHGAEVFAAGTNNVWTLGGAPSSGTFTLNIWDGAQNIVIAAIANTVTAAALDTSIEAALAAAGYGANAVVVAGGPLNTTAITITFNGTTGLGTAAKPFYLYKTADTTSPAVTVVNTTPGVRGKHTFTPQSTQGFWTTFVRSVGTSVVQRHSMVDCLIGGFTIESSQAQKDMRITPNLLSLNPYKIVAADPAQALPSGADARPFFYTEAQNTVTLGTGASTAIINGASAVSLTVNEDRSPAYGDDVVPYDFAVGSPTVAVSLTFIFDSVGLGRWNELVYGTATPATGATPLRGIPSAGSLTADWKQKGPAPDGTTFLTGNEAKATLPSLNWDVPPAPPPNPGGGLAEVTIGGTLAPSGAVTPYTLDLWTADNATFAS